MYGVYVARYWQCWTAGVAPVRRGWAVLCGTWPLPATSNQPPAGHDWAGLFFSDFEGQQVMRNKQRLCTTFHLLHNDGMGRMLLEPLSFTKIYSPQAGYFRASVRDVQQCSISLGPLIFTCFQRGLNTCSPNRFFVVVLETAAF